MPGGGAEGASPRWRTLVRDVPDFPRAGVLFKDIGPLLADAAGLAEVVALLADAGRDDMGRVTVDSVAGVEARGFILAAPVALALGVGFVPVRKAGRLPGAVLGQSYALEYGEATLEIAQDAFRPGERVLLVDDVLATGGTLEAAVGLVARTGATTGAVAVLIELAFLTGRRRLGQIPVTALTTV